MKRFSGFGLVKQAFRHQEHWQRMWRNPKPRKHYDIIIVGAGGATGSIQAILLGGAAGSFVGPDQLDLPLTLEATRDAGTTLGSGVIMVFAEGSDMADIVARIAEFFRDEACGQCVPCRVGTVRQVETLVRLRSAEDRERDLALLADLDAVMTDASICGLGQTAASAIRSAQSMGLLDGSAQ